MGEKYNDEQRAALWEAYLDSGIRPTRRVVELAKRGELMHGGERVDPFTIGEQYASQLIRAEQKRRQGRAKTGLATLEPRDQIEVVRQRLVSMGDRQSAHLERVGRKRLWTTQEAERYRQIARGLRELAAVPGLNDPRPVKPGQKIPGAGNVTNGGATTGGLAGQIIAANARGSAHVPEEDPRQSKDIDTEQHGERSAAQHDAEPQTQAENDGPGAWMREEVGMMQE